MMSLADDYRQQAAWRDWSRVLDALPSLGGRTILDLGCGVGDQAAQLVARGARVIGIDANEELLAAVRSLCLPDAEFRAGDLRAPLNLGGSVDGIWCSFVAAYFPDLASALASWTEPLRPDGWIALTEIDDLFGHEPLSARAKSLLGAYADESVATGRYDFRMGRKLRGALERSGFRVDRQFALSDQELAFDGPARPDVVDAWGRRFDRMTLLRDFCGAEFAAVRDDFLACLASPVHRASAQVVCCVAKR